MPHNSFVRGGVGSGAYTNYTVLHGVLEQIDQYLFQSLNADLGGTWAPASVITIGGAGLDVTGPFQADGTSLFNNAASFVGAVDFNSSVIFAVNVVTISGAGSTKLLFTSGAMLQGNAGTTFTWAGTFGVSGTSTFSALATFSGTLASTTLLAANAVTVAGALTAAGATTISSGASLTIANGATMALNGLMSLSTTGPAGILPRYLAMPNATTTILANTYDFIDVTQQSANHDLILNDCPDNTHVVVSMALAGGSGTNGVLVKNQALSLITTLRCQQTGFPDYAHLVRVGGAWKIFFVNVWP